MTFQEIVAYWERRPCNILHSKVAIEDDPLQYHHEVTARKYTVEPHILEFAKFPSWAGKRVMELGCGIGTDTISFARVGAEVFAVDASVRSLAVAKKRAEALALADQIVFYPKNIEEHMGAIWPFDLVYSFGVIHHTEHPTKVLWNAHDYLKDDGTLKIMIYHRKSWKVAKILLKNLPKLLLWRDIDRVVALESEAQAKCPITRTYTKKSARELLESCGFEVQEMKVAHIFPYRVKKYIQGDLEMAFPWKLMPERVFHWVESHFGWHLLITATKSKGGHNEGEN